MQKKTKCFLGILSISFIFMSIITSPLNVQAAEKEVLNTQYKLDTGVTFAWKNSKGVWQNGIYPGKTEYSINVLTNIGANRKNIEIEPYNKTNFTFNKQTDSVYFWNNTPATGNVSDESQNKNNYDERYYNYSGKINSLSGENSYNYSTGNMNVYYNVDFNPIIGEVYNVKEKLAWGNKQEILDLLGNPSQEIATAMNLMDPTSQSFNPNVEGYLYFFPIVIKYDEVTYIEEPVEANLSLPSSALVGETYTAKDMTAIPSGTTLQSTKLEKDTGSGWTAVSGWDGSKLGSSISQSSSVAGSIRYRLTVTLTDGRSDTDIKTIEINEIPLVLDAQLTLPTSAEAGETYIAKDDTILPAGGVLARTKLEKHDGDWNWTSVSGWDGSKIGSQKNETAFNLGTITYRLTIELTNGTIDTDTKIIKITQTPANGIANLDLDAVTYEGHPANAKDISEFTYNGEYYTAERAYDEGIANNNFRVVENASSNITRVSGSDTKTKITFWNRGTYHLKLEVQPKNGVLLTAQKPIEVRATPSLSATLSGRQKENRRQILTVTAATYPGKPITEMWIKIINPATGETAKYTLDKNDITTNIKSRPITEEKNDYFTTWTLEFLTKFTTGTSLSYSAYAKDSKGDTDTIVSDFYVEPDILPFPLIEMQDTYIRNQGSNIANIETEDKTMASDGDSVERTWTIADDTDGDSLFNDETYYPLSVFNGQNLSFGTNKKIVLDKNGVGKLNVKLKVKEFWTEATLPEFIMPSDYKTSEITKTTEVTNVAPVVSLEPINIKTASVLILTGGKAEYDDLAFSVNSMKKAFLENGVDAKVKVVQMEQPQNSEMPERAFALDTAAAHDTKDTWFENKAFTVDDNRIYIITPTYTSKAAGVKPTMPCLIRAWDAHTVDQHINPTALWTYTLTSDVLDLGMTTIAPTIGNDDTDTYLYIIYNGKTLLLDKKTGAYVDVLNVELGKTNYVTNQYIYTFKPSGVYKVSVASGEIKLVLSGASDVSKRIEGKVNYMIHSGASLYKCKFDLSTEQVTYTELEAGAPGTTVCSLIDIDSAGQFFVRLYSSTGTANVYSTSGKLLKSVSGVSPTYTNYFAVSHDKNNMFGYIFTSYMQRSNGTTKRYYTNVYVYGVNSSFSSSMYINPTGDYGTFSDRIIAAYESDDSVYLVTGSVRLFINTSYYNQGNAYSFKFNKTTGIGSAGSISDFGISAAAEYGLQSDSLLAVASVDNYIGLAANEGTESRLMIKPQSITAILTRYLENYANHDEQINAVIVSDSLNYDDTSDIKEAVNIIKANGIDFFYLGNMLEENYTRRLASLTNGSAIVNVEKTTATAIANSVIALREDKDKILEVRISNSGILSKNVKLTPGKKYYYEYDIKPESGITSDVLSTEPILKNTLTDDYFSDDALYYVTNSYLEDFGDTDYNSFFTLTAGAINSSNGKMVVTDFSAGKTSDNYWMGNATTFSFTVPEGSKGVLSSDLDIYLTSVGLMGVYVAVDGVKWSIPGTLGTGQVWNGAYTHTDLLSPGQHTITFCCYVDCQAPSWDWMKVDNLKVDLVSTQKPIVESSSSISTISNGWSRIKGSFSAPSSTIAYQPQAMTYYSGALVGTYGYESGSTTSIKQYYVTVPTGMSLVRGDMDISWYCGRTSIQAWCNGTNYSSYPKSSYPDTNISNPYTINMPRYSAASIIVKGSWSNYSQLFVYFNKLEMCMLPTAKDNALITANKFVIDKANSLIYVPNTTFNGETALKLSFKKAGNCKMQNLKIYTIENGIKNYVSDEYFADNLALSDWTAENATFGIGVDDKIYDEEIKMTYKKGELVSYNIHYSDYENDPSKKQYWSYTHTPFNDGAHPDAANIIDEDGNVVSSTGKILSTSIPRFYVDGKYMVEHWQEDNTTRPISPVGNLTYDKESNIESIAFYIEGGSSVPWITHIKTNPAKVLEGTSYQLNIGVDDAEKDELRLTTEIYKDKKLISKHNQTGISANSLGQYPSITVTPESLAALGVYDIVCTVRDWSGAGIGNYKFNVVSDAKIEGWVKHTDEWNNNRKKYNLSKSGNENLPRTEKIFWSGENFMLEAACAGNPSSVAVEILGYSNYHTVLTNTGIKNSKGEYIFKGNLWDKSMINKWGRKTPESLNFVFTAFYTDGISKTCMAEVIIDNKENYWRIHRLY